MDNNITIKQQQNYYLNWIKFTFMHLADAFIQSDLQLHSGYTFFSICVPWESNPQPFALLMQCSTTEPQEHSKLKAVSFAKMKNMFFYKKGNVLVFKVKPFEFYSLVLIHINAFY